MKDPAASIISDWIAGIRTPMKVQIGVGVRWRVARDLIVVIDRR